MDALAELRYFHSRPFSPTRRLAVGKSNLPVDPAPGPGGLLLGAIVAANGDELDEDAFDNMTRLTLQLQEGQRIIQPRLRHRFQEDRHGLARSRIRLVHDGDSLAIDRNEDKGSGFQAMVVAVYAAGALPPAARRLVMDAIRKGLRWKGDVDRSLFAHLAGHDRGGGWTSAMYDDPVRWALATLGLEVDRNGSGRIPDRKAIVRQFRVALRDAHPDHGGDTDDAAVRIDDLTEARRILLS